MKILDRVKIVGENYNGKEGILTGINNNIASVVMRYEVDNKLYGYIRVEVNVLDLEEIL